MSACLSVTAITSVETRLNAATAMISARMMNIMRFSICTAREVVARSAASSRVTSRFGAQRLRQLARHLRRALACRAASAARRSAVDAEQPLRVARYGSAPARCRIRSGPNSKIPTTRELLQPRHHAGRRDLPCGAISVILSPSATPQRARQFAAEHDAEFAGVQRGQRPAAHLRRDVATPLGSAAGSMPRTSTPRTRVAARQQRLRVDIRRGADDLPDCCRASARPPASRSSAVDRANDLDVRRPPTACGRAPAS